jgi:hypothetical protein
VIDFKLATHGNGVEYEDKVVGISQGKGVGLDATIAWDSIKQKDVTLLRLMLQLPNILRC